MKRQRAGGITCACLGWRRACAESGHERARTRRTKNLAQNRAKYAWIRLNGPGLFIPISAHLFFDHASATDTPPANRHPRWSVRVADSPRRQEIAPSTPARLEEGIWC